MNADERTPGQQGYGQQTSQQAERQPTSEATTEPADTPQETGQAAYGNSGGTGTMTEGSSQGQEADLGQADRGESGAMFQGSEDDTGGSASGQASAEQSQDQQDSGSGQAFADQGQGASADEGTTDIEVERSQGRESDIEGKSL